MRRSCWHELCLLFRNRTSHLQLKDLNGLRRKSWMWLSKECRGSTYQDKEPCYDLEDVRQKPLRHRRKH